MVNKVILVGNLGKEVELKKTQDGKSYALFSVATSENWVDHNKQKKELTEWHYITVFGKIAENCKKYLKKGDRVFIEGKIRSSVYDKDGEKRTSYKILADDVKFLSPKRDANEVIHVSNPMPVEQDILNDIPF